MSSKNLEEFLNNSIKKENDKRINWDDEKNQWLKEVNNFYSNVEEWLKPFIDKNQIQVDFKEIDLNEEYIGRYKTKSMYIFISKEKVIIEPIGRLIIGSQGRIDMTGKNGKIRFLLVDENSKGPKIRINIEDSESNEENEDLKLVWKIATPSPDIKFLSLNSDSFADYLLEIIK